MFPRYHIFKINRQTFSVRGVQPKSFLGLFQASGHQAIYRKFDTDLTGCCFAVE